MSDLSGLKFFTTPAHKCSYLENQKATTLFVDPAADYDSDLYTSLTQLGFRRSGDYVYRPHCETCSACVPVRIPVSDFSPSRNQKRNIKKNKDLVVSINDARIDDELYNLYSSYINNKHSDGDMYPPTREQFESFLFCAWSKTVFVEFRTEGRLIAVAAMDELYDGCSAVYTFYDTNETSRSLGTYAVLWMIENTIATGKPYVYLGYWIKECQKMNYKSQYRPLELYINNQWVNIT